MSTTTIEREHESFRDPRAGGLFPNAYPQKEWYRGAPLPPNAVEAFDTVLGADQSMWFAVEGKQVRFNRYQDVEDSLYRTFVIPGECFADGSYACFALCMKTTVDGSTFYEHHAGIERVDEQGRVEIVQEPMAGSDEVHAGEVSDRDFMIKLIHAAQQLSHAA